MITLVLLRHGESILEQRKPVHGLDGCRPVGKRNPGSQAGREDPEKGGVLL